MFEEKVALMNQQTEAMPMISSRTAYKLVKSGAFHTVHVGGHYRIPKKGFERWLKSVRYGKRGAR